MNDLNHLAALLQEAEARIARQLRLIAELDCRGHQQDRIRARELLAAMTETGNAIRLHLGTAQRFGCRLPN